MRSFETGYSGTTTSRKCSRWGSGWPKSQQRLGTGSRPSRLAGFSRKSEPGGWPNFEGVDLRSHDRHERPELGSRLSGRGSSCGVRNKAHRSANGKVQIFWIISTSSSVDCCNREHYLKAKYHSRTVVQITSCLFFALTCFEFVKWETVLLVWSNPN